MKNKIITLLLVVAMIFVFAACSEPSPTDVADDFLTAVKTQDKEALSKVYIEENFDVADAADSSDLPEDLQKEIVEKIFDFDYELGEEKIEGDEAAVEVKITTYDVGSAFTEFIGEYISQAFGLALSGTSEEDAEELALEIFEEKFKELEEKDYTENVRLELKKTDEGWKVSEIDDDSAFLNAVTGGLIHAIKKIDEALDE